MKEAGVGFENANMAISQNMSDGAQTGNRKTCGTFLGNQKPKNQTRKERRNEARSHIRKKLQENIDSMKGKNFLEQVQKLTLSGTWKRGLALTTPCLG